MATLPYTIRPAQPRDIPSINAIYTHYVLHTVITFATEPNSNDTALANFKKVKAEGLPYLVATDENDKTVLGYAYVSGFRGERPAYRHSLELSLFCDPNHCRKGVGAFLLTQIIDILKKPQQFSGYFEGTRLIESKPRQLIAVAAIDIDGPGNGIKLVDWYVQFGFVAMGRLLEVGWKKERWVDTAYLQLALRP